MKGCLFENGVVRTPSGFKEAYKTFCDGGWASLSCSPEYGAGHAQVAGQFGRGNDVLGQPKLCMYPGLTHGASLALEAFGTPEQKEPIFQS